jgi:MFS family permease
MATPSLTLYAEQSFGAGALLVGAVVAGFAIGRLLLDVPSGFIVGRLGTNKTMFAGLAGLVASSIVAGLAPDLPTLFAMRVAEGVASSIYVTGAVTYVLLSGTATKRGGLMGTYHSMLMVGHIIGPIIGAPIATMFGLNAPYFAFAGMISAALVALAAFQRAGRIRVRTESGPSEIQTNNKNSSSNMMAVYLNSASIATFGFAFLRSGVYNTALPLFAYGQLGLSIVEVGTIFTVASMASLVSAFFASRLTSRFGMRGPIAASMLLASMLVAIVPHMQGMVHLLVVFTLVGLASGFFGQSVAWAANIVEEKVKKREQLAARQDDANGDKRHAVKDTSSLLPHHRHYHHDDDSNDNHLAKGLGFNRMMGDAGLIAGPLACGFLFSLSGGGNAEWTVPFLIIGAVLMSTSIALAGRQGGDFVARWLGPVRIGRQ